MSAVHSSRQTGENESLDDSFRVEYPVVKDAMLQEFVQAARAKAGTEFVSEAAFNSYCRGVIQAWHDTVAPTRFPNPTLAEKLSQIGPHNKITDGRTDGGSIPTSWGGVLIDEVEPGRKPPDWQGEYQGQAVKKWLVIKPGGYLALERHSVKEETLEVEKGAGFILYEEPGSAGLKSAILLPKGSGDGISRIVLNPEAGAAFGPWHCVIGFGLTLFETSQDHLGMDRDLLFKFKPTPAGK